MKIKVGLVSAGVGGGSDVMAYQLAAGLFESGKFTPVILTPNPSIFFEMIKSNFNIPVITSPEFNQFHGATNFESNAFFSKIKRSAELLQDLIEGLNLDLVISATNTFAEGAIASRNLKIPHITWVQGYVTESVLNIVHSQQQQSLEKAQLALSANVVYVSNWAESFATQRYGFPIKGKVIHNWKKVLQTKTFSDDGNQFVIGYFGNFESHKGFTDLLKAVNLVREVIPNVLVEVYSAANPTSEILHYISKFDLHKVINFMGKTNDSISSMSGCNLVVIPSRIESFSLVALEAAIAGVPVIASRVGGLKEVVAENYSGFLFDAGDYRSLAMYLEKSFNNPANLLQLGSQAKAHAISKFNEAKQLSKFIELIEETIHNHRRQQPTLSSNLFEYLEFDTTSHQKEDNFHSVLVTSHKEFSKEIPILFTFKKMPIRKDMLLPTDGYLEFHFLNNFDYSIENIVLDLKLPYGGGTPSAGIELVKKNEIVYNLERPILEGKFFSLCEFSIPSINVEQKELLALRIFTNSKIPVWVSAGRGAVRSNLKISSAEGNNSELMRWPSNFNAKKYTISDGN